MAAVGVITRIEQIFFYLRSIFLCILPLLASYRSILILCIKILLARVMAVAYLGWVLGLTSRMAQAQIKKINELQIRIELGLFVSQMSSNQSCCLLEHG